ncbi:MAG: transcriptional repressor [Atopobiaceae bacterium]|jgi:Fe2+ or Zn2+ uptake regulation protein|nr:transcriptional repressor [Atopobiaceae bacterium]MCH4120402.1 transcriptional repressor [Atopobiaceae bacterium]MCI1389679.1 transcriptional repressor [Atopobiaceae bacterium]MCI1431919.1 transcriptional repressor [Atopobiaceae bacterium]MCI1470355.1 transcriptional repressor [Atopobiaceae bacterium]
MGANAREDVPRRRNTRQRELVLSSVEGRCDHPSAEQVYEDVRDVDPHVSRATVYRNLHLLVDTGSIVSIRTEDGERFDRRTDDHAHIICQACGKVEDAPAPDLGDADERAAQATGFVVRGHAVVFSGICPECQAKARAKTQA